MGYYAGLFFDFTSEKGAFLFQPGIQFNSRGGSFAGKTTRLNYLEIPLSFSYKVARGFVLGHQDLRAHGSPYVGLNLNSSNLAISPAVSGIKKADYGIRSGLSFGLGSFEPFLGYDFGLADISANPAYKISNRGFYLSFALTAGK